MMYEPGVVYRNMQRADGDITAKHGAPGTATVIAGGTTDCSGGYS
ncbi:hypothetical protein R69888_02232 [Paraburkholderia haematera]|uniref:Uncharacterized protein n=1 Tax=Paraburkholderia haematera TaxID=2793077 RepID=A0ABM8R629_9BURK|nr:hypothetical protein R69888_02232 [Paraburkholderia haematera]